MSVSTQEVVTSIGFNIPSQFDGISNNFGNCKLTAHQLGTAALEIAFPAKVADEILPAVITSYCRSTQ